MSGERLAAQPSSFASIAVLIAGWLIVAIGVLHLVVGVMSSDRFTLGLLWFEGSGIALILIGAITQLTRRLRDPALVALSVAANVLGLALGIAFCVLTEWREPQGIALIVLFSVATIACVGLGRPPRRSE